MKDLDTTDVVCSQFSIKLMIIYTVSLFTFIILIQSIKSPLLIYQ